MSYVLAKLGTRLCILSDISTQAHKSCAAIQVEEKFKRIKTRSHNSLIMTVTLVLRPLLPTPKEVHVYWGLLTKHNEKPKLADYFMLTGYIKS